MLDCFNDLHIGIKQTPPATVTEYVHKGKTYRPSDVGLSSFHSVKSVYVGSLTADLMDRERRAGSVTMTVVIENAGFGCYGQSYSAKKSISNLDGKAASKRLSDFSLSNATMVGGATDFEIESKIKGMEAQAKAEEAAKAQGVVGSTGGTGAPGAIGATGSVASGTGNAAVTASTGVTAPPGQVTTTESTQALEQRRRQEELAKYQKQVNENMKQIDQSSKQFGEKSVKAAGYMGDAASGAWNSGAGLGLGLLMNDEDNGFFVSVMMAQWKDSWTGKAPPKEFWAGGLVYMTIGLENSEPVQGIARKPSDAEVTQAQMGFNILTNLFGWDTTRIIVGPVMYLENTYGPMGEKLDEYKTKFGLDLGLAMAGNGVLGTFTYNITNQLYGFHLAWHKKD